MPIGSATILAYHAIGRCARGEDSHNLFVDPKVFRRQMEFLLQKRQVVDIHRILSGPMAQAPMVAITFDDAFRGILDHALAILQRFHFPATVFVPTGWVGEAAGWLGAQRCDVNVMSEDELREAQSGGLSLQSHGHRHIDMGHASEDEIRQDVASSVGVLRRITGEPPRYLAYPYGRSSPDAQRAVREAGFSAAFGIDVPGRDRFSFERTQVTPLDGPRLFALKTSGRYLAWRHHPAVRAGYAAVKPLARRFLDPSRRYRRHA